ncbi:MAG: hypothetical protein AAGH90_03340 [Pseudomonadota bacterium]
MREIIISSLILFGCVACSHIETADTFVLQNGIELPLHPDGTLQERCEVFGSTSTEQDDAVCVEFPASVINREFEPLNWYSRLLIEAGFEWASGAANQYWFNWPTSDGCFQRLNATALPKERIEGDDWADMKDYVAVFEFEPEQRCKEK